MQLSSLTFSNERNISKHRFINLEYKIIMKTLKYFLIICLFLLNSCEKNETGDSNEKFVPTDVLVKTKGYYTIDKVFNFINSFDHNVEYIEDGIYTSSLPSDSLQYVLDYLNAKS